MFLIFSPNSEDFVTASHLGAAGRVAVPGPRAFAAHSSARWTRVSCGLGSVRSTEEAHHCHLGWRVWKWSGQAGRVRVSREWENTVLHQEQVPSAARCGPAGLGGASGALDTGVLFLDERPRRMFHSSHCKTDRIRSELLKILPVRSGVVVCVNWAGPPGVPEAPRHDPWAVSLGVRRGVGGWMFVKPGRGTQLDLGQVTEAWTQQRCPVGMQPLARLPFPPATPGSPGSRGLTQSTLGRTRPCSLGSRTVTSGTARPRLETLLLHTAWCLLERSPLNQIFGSTANKGIIMTREDCVKPHVPRWRTDRRYGKAEKQQIRRCEVVILSLRVHSAWIPGHLTATFAVTGTRHAP